ncbi:hypothetical protein [Kitasatospora cineracea]|uniref:hypothetical protein n=1 Tax=Kitasatospora cineracea TaxID=88074 RepID=UPI000F47C6CA|nr:hypothetical protein [Kitasatospora cineracea]
MRLEGIQCEAGVLARHLRDGLFEVAPVLVDLLGELPYGVRHFAVVVFVHVRPVDPDQIQDPGQFVGQNDAHQHPPCFDIGRTLPDLWHSHLVGTRHLEMSS